jgi:hypothetical protein
MISCRIKERITIRSAKLNIELCRSLNGMLITKRSTSKKILDILFLGDINPSEVEETSIPKK